MASFLSCFGVFSKVLLGVGLALIAIGTSASILNSGASAEGGLLESIANGFASTFFALFSGVMVGVGTAISFNSAIILLKGNKTRIIAAFLFCILSALVSMFAIAGTQSSFLLLILFFSGLSAAATFLASSLAFALSGAAKKYLSESE